VDGSHIMTETYQELGGQPTTQLSDHNRFLAALPRHIHVDKTAALGTALTMAFLAGWTPEQIAAEVSREWPANGRGGLVQHRVERINEAKRKPPVNLPKGRTAPWCGRCEDDKFRYLCDGNGRPLQPCPTCHPGSLS